MEGVGHTLVLADSDVDNPTNLNRIDGVFSGVGETKISQIARAVSETDPDIRQIHLPDETLINELPLLR